jgi:hypothetical protein
MTQKVESIKLRAAGPPTEYNEEFLQGMIDRMMVSYHKYGAVSDGFPDRVDAIGSLKLRLDKYAETGNTEFLIDAANFCMIEFMHPRHKDAHFRPTDSNESPGRLTQSGNLNRTDRNERLIRKP